MKDKKNILVLVRGVPGSGKSSFSADMAEDGGLPKHPVFAADDFFMVEGEYKFDPSKLHMAHKDCQRRTEEAMKNEEPKIFVCNTFVKARDLKPYMELADEYGYKCYTVVVENRHGKTTVHGVPDEKLVEMEKDLRNNLKFR